MYQNTRANVKFKMSCTVRDAHNSTHPITVDIEINGQVFNMEIDTGAAVSIISKATYQKLFSEVPIKSASLCLRTYTGE